MLDEDKTRNELLAELRLLRAEREAVEQSRRRCSAVVEHALEPVLLIDDATRYVDVNPAACQLVGYTREEFLRLTAWDVTPPEYHDRIPGMLTALLADGTLSGEYTLLCKDGTTRDVEFRAVANILPGLHMAVQRDVTARKTAEKERRRQDEILRTIFDHIPVMIAFIGPEGRLDLVNREWERVLGWSLEEARQRDMAAELHPDPGERLRAFEHILNPPQGWADFRTRVRDGRMIDTSWANVLLSDGTSIGIGQDVTERKRAEQIAEQYAGRLRSLSCRLVEVQEEERRHLARELHDEIGQLLTCLNFALEGSGGGGPRLAEARSLLREILGRVRELSFDLRPALLDHLGLVPALRGLIERFTSGTRLRVNFNHAGLDGRFPPELETAAYRIVQEGLTNVARHARTPEAAVRVWVDGGCLQVQVEDQGKGFDPEAALAAGRSSGLPGMHERVTLLGGRLTIESTPGGGTHLMAELPLEPSAGDKADGRVDRPC